MSSRSDSCASRPARRWPLAWRWWWPRPRRCSWHGLAATAQPGEVLGAALFMPGLVARREREVHQQAMQVLELGGLSRGPQESGGTLWGGQRKLWDLARALITEPRMILLDEPMA